MDDIQNRLRVFWIPERDMIDFLRIHDRVPQFIAVPQITPLPDGAKVVRSWMDHNRRSFGFLVEHESFDIVPHGAYAPDGDPVVLERKAYRLYPPENATLFHDNTNIGSLSRDELLALRERVNTAIYDLERA